MPHLSGIFEQFKDLSQITVVEVSKHLTSKVELHQLENIIGNKFLYPQTVPVTILDEDIELAILSTLLNRDPVNVLTHDRIVLSAELVNHFPHLDKLIRSIITAVEIPEVTSIFIKRNGSTYRVGTAIKLDQTIDQVHVNGKTLKVPLNQITVVPFSSSSLLIDIPNKPSVLSSGGEVGIVFDSRKKDV